MELVCCVWEVVIYGTQAAVTVSCKTCEVTIVCVICEHWECTNLLDHNHKDRSFFKLDFALLANKTKLWSHAQNDFCACRKINVSWLVSIVKAYCFIQSKCEESLELINVNTRFEVYVWHRTVSDTVQLMLELHEVSRYGSFTPNS